MPCFTVNRNSIIEITKVFFNFSGAPNVAKTDIRDAQQKLLMSWLQISSVLVFYFNVSMKKCGISVL